jgi:hypothetical protein
MQVMTQYHHTIPSPKLANLKGLLGGRVVKPHQHFIYIGALWAVDLPRLIGDNQGGVRT